MALRELLSPDALQLGPGLRRDDAVMWRWGAGEMDSRLCGNDAGSGVSDVDSGGEVPGWAGRSGSASSGAAQASRSGINLFSQTASPLKDARSGIKIRDQLVLKVRDHVLDPQLALLEAADPQFDAGRVGVRRAMTYWPPSSGRSVELSCANGKIRSHPPSEIVQPSKWSRIAPPYANSA